MKKINFRDWTVEKIEDAFGLRQEFDHPVLERLVSFQYEISDMEKMILSKLQYNYKRFGGEDWNEAELATKFINPLIVFSDIDNITGKNFAFSKTFVSDQSDIFDIYKTLKSLIYEIEQLISN
jgi:hypothetical protein